MVQILVPTLGESVTEATVAQWLKKEGEAVAADEVLVELETDKVSIEVPAPQAGVLSAITVQEGETVEVGALLGEVGEGNGAAPAVPAAPAKEEVKAAPTPAAPKAAASPAPAAASSVPAAPSARRISAESGLDLSAVEGTGRGGRITKGDALKALEQGTKAAPAPAPTAAREVGALEERVPMSRLRRTIATRLKEAQETAAILTTFNEVDMSHVMAVRSKYKDLFEKKHGVRLGFMSFFVKACLAALKDIPNVNAEIDGTDIIYKNHYDIGVAVGTDKGLVVPVVRDADQLSLGGIELAINELGRKARDGQLTIEDMQGGTFTISNGGVYGSLMSTPILNRPQSGILGMHKIQERPMVVDGQIVVRPMMYLALSYDHRIVDGKEAVTFLVRVKECLEEPERLILDL
ncbi:MAG: 2-oxoglutarate dehydrogenase complex dihydrolipoyllysine-residue succinyltransferase [Alphaproteobacteria bacterium]|nr:MAG: 2-oxoglutarate dehydrogenase complex dihydrolipoyllysine-residue succinyltransferase [Alphaproteobacteria bacterium]